MLLGGVRPGGWFYRALGRDPDDVGPMAATMAMPPPPPPLSFSFAGKFRKK